MMAISDGGVGWMSGSAGVSSGLHVLVRPEWCCSWCGEQWPCLWAQAFMVEDFPDLAALARHMNTLMEDAAAELPGVTPGQLWDRFLGWLDPLRLQQIGELPPEPPPRPWWRPASSGDAADTAGPADRV
jgi:hypothetical protein